MKISQFLSMYLIPSILKLILISICFDTLLSLPLRIFGGSEVTIDKYSYQLSLIKQNKHACGAIIINKLWALTAADCVKGATSNDITLRAGSSSNNAGGIVHIPIQIILHPNYNDQNKDYNIAIIKVKTQFDSKTTKPITMASEGSIIKPGTEAVATGWGLLSPGSSGFPEKLQKGILPTRDQDECRIANGNLATIRTFCAGYTSGGIDICTGDIGGPLVYQDKLIGIVSLSKSCGNANGFSIFTSISELRSWIKRTSGV